MVEALARPEMDPTWTRPNALLIPRTPTHSLLSDASYGGLGGWSPDFSIMWRVMRDTLLDFGFPMREIDLAGEPADLARPKAFISTLLSSLESLSTFGSLFVCC
jgi:hypothetical protein